MTAVSRETLDEAVTAIRDFERRWPPPYSLSANLKLVSAFMARIDELEAAIKKLASEWRSEAIVMDVPLDSSHPLAAIVRQLDAALDGDA